MLNFSGRMWDEATKQACFEVGLPIYKEETDGYTLLGSAYLYSMWEICRKSWIGRC